MLKICGPKLSLCGLIISAWGIVQLVLMGVFYYVQSVGLAEDLAIMEHNYDTSDAFFTAANNAYAQNAYNCWIAACLYIFTLLICGQQFYQNSRNSLDA